VCGGRPVVKIIAGSLSQHDEKYGVPTPLGGIRIGKERHQLGTTVPARYDFFFRIRAFSPIGLLLYRYKRNKSQCTFTLTFLKDV
jgi:hypothetical protein